MNLLRACRIASEIDAKAWIKVSRRTFSPCTRCASRIYLVNLHWPRKQQRNVAESVAKFEYSTAIRHICQRRTPANYVYLGSCDQKPFGLRIIKNMMYKSAGFSMSLS